RVPTDAPPAVSYDDLGARGPSAYKPSRYTVADLGVPVVDLSKEVVIDPKAKPGSLAERALRRAYNGAPPVVPHATEQISDRECVACHSTGLEIGGKRASLIPHAYYANCQQCHVAASPILPEHPLAQNSFAGMPAPTEGGRAWKGAPPVIPHSTWMREQCLSCHGPLGKAGMQTPHPGRVNCMQCHARSSALDPREPTVATLVYRPPVELRHGVNPMQETAPEAEAP
ncbi:MAG: multiheme c-type cytochrome, partial [Candidatus Eisenbacteria bacterium]